MKHLNNKINCTNMKFWGKIFGLYCDYYIIQVRCCKKLRSSEKSLPLKTKVEHEKEIPFDEIDIIHQTSDRIQSKLNQRQVNEIYQL